VRKAYDEVFETRKFDVKFNLAELVVLSPEMGVRAYKLGGTHHESEDRCSEL
jgi:hypothetical protein